MAWRGGAWSGLTSKAALMLQERDQLKARARDEAAVIEARKNKVTVTVDLLGRQVTSYSRLPTMSSVRTAKCNRTSVTQVVWLTNMGCTLLAQAFIADMRFFVPQHRECATVTLPPS